MAVPRYFTKEEAEKLLAQIRPLMEEAQRRTMVLERLQAETEAIEKRIRGNGHAGQGKRLAEKQEALRETGRGIAALVEQVQALGVEVKDLGMGLVDFRALREGEEVYLCWRVGESGIEWWHTLDGGFSGRKPL